jgi:transposase
MAYKCRAYPDEAQQAMLARTFGCVRLVWNRTLAARHRLYHAEGKGLSYAASDAALTAMKKDPDLAFLAGVSSVPLQQALRHQYKAFSAFFARQRLALSRCGFAADHLRPAGLGMVPCARRTAQTLKHGGQYGV